MTPRENLLRLYRRQGGCTAPVSFTLCPGLEREFKKRHPDASSYADHFGFPLRGITDPGFSWNFEEMWRIPERKVDWHKFYPEGFSHEVKFDGWGIAHESNPNSQHMTYMHNPLKNFDSIAQFEDYPWPDFKGMDWSFIKPIVNGYHARGLAVADVSECTIWETAWYLRSMDNLFVEMATDDDKAVWLLDKITDFSCFRARKFAEAGVDILDLGDDIGMQSTPMMSMEMYRTWLKPRLAKVISAARAVNPDIIVFYHSCGFCKPFINDLIEAGVDVLNPVQPECPGMEFNEIFAEFGGRISFNGTIGTQKLMPFGKPEEVRSEVLKNLEIAGDKGGLFCCPTHMLEPEVPWTNIEAYVAACREYRG